MNRGSNEARPENIPAHVASMRPRFMNRGSHTKCRVKWYAAHRFNEAPIHESGK